MSFLKINFFHRIVFHSSLSYFLNLLLFCLFHDFVIHFFTIKKYSRVQWVKVIVFLLVCVAALAEKKVLTLSCLHVQTNWQFIQLFPLMQRIKALWCVCSIVSKRLRRRMAGNHCISLYKTSVTLLRPYDVDVVRFDFPDREIRLLTRRQRPPFYEVKTFYPVYQVLRLNFGKSSISFYSWRSCHFKTFSHINCIYVNINNCSLLFLKESQNKLTSLKLMSKWLVVV